MDNQYDRIALIEMERRLLADKDGAYRRSLLNTLSEHLSEIKIKLSGGLRPEEYEVYSKLRDAIDSAVKVLQNFK